MDYSKVLESRLNQDNLVKLRELENPYLDELIATAILKFQPRSVFISTGSPEDLHYSRVQALINGEEKQLTIPGHTIHYDGAEDQGRDPANTKFCVSDPDSLGSGVAAIERTAGLKEVDLIMDRIMNGREMIVSFYSLGPLNTEFAIPCVQITDSFYVAHSEDILYRQGYELFRSQKGRPDFFKFIHSSGELENGVSKDIDLRRIYVDLESNAVYSTNTQYAGNTVAAKKLAHRLAIKKASQEGWLSEHLFLSGVPGYEGDKVTYISGAFPSWCGKTSTSMLFDVVGDDLAHLRKIGGRVYAANVEKGMFGVIKDVNPEDDPYIHDLLVNPNEIIFSNVLSANARIFWQGMGNVDVPLRGINQVGEWWQGKRDKKGNKIPLSHDNARFCVALSGIKNFDHTEVVPCEGIIYGGRSAQRPVPVSQSYSWAMGVFYGASIESEPTAATVGGSGTKIIINPMANNEFLSISVGEYLQSHLKFGRDLKTPPLVFYVNYFLRNDAGKFTNTKMDKKVWVRWIERRINGHMGAYATPIGYIPKYEDLAELFKIELHTTFTRDDYDQQFQIRVRQLLEKLDGVEGYYRRETSAIPAAIFAMIDIQRKLLVDIQKKHGSPVPPEAFKDYPIPQELVNLSC
ncbi:MAG: phosphoenolpyruvate carboxykinase (GTP) [Deltaproteobacteria bacterium]|nr:phosphoenolpyruvate carboxykinase (GTP) [Deltaproteobacteria bacterium]